jgi:hypothetical protein
MILKKLNNVESIKKHLINIGAANEEQIGVLYNERD